MVLKKIVRWFDHPFRGLVILFVFCLLLTVNLKAQQAILRGVVSDSITGEVLPGVNIRISDSVGTTTNEQGSFSLFLLPGDYKMIMSFVGFKTRELQVTANPGDTLDLNVKLQNTSINLGMAVVTAGKYEQRLSDVTVSVSVMKPAFIEDVNTLSMDRTLNYMPGVEVLDGQPSIRGGGGYSYGAGSRVAVLVDDLPALSPAEGDVKWNFIPVEQLEQVEVLKGASSALYGSSSLNGVVNFLTQWPGETPITTINLYGGFYTYPERREMAWWWESLPLFTGASFSHVRKIGNTDIVLSSNALINQGYRTDNFDQQVRAGCKVRHRSRKNEKLSYGLNTSFQWQYMSDFFIWVDADSGAFMQDPAIVNINSGIRFNADPWVTLFDARNNKHSLQTRYYRVTNNFDTKPQNNNESNLYFAQYQYQRQFDNGLNVTAGTAGTINQAQANLYGDHRGTGIALFTQFDYKFFGRLSTSLGVRWEYNQLDHDPAENGTVVRVGINYEAAPRSFIRGSFGQGYRFPSIAEKYTATSVGSVNIFPNPDLKSETGWSAELGFRQGVKIRNWNTFLDAAFYWTEYDDMIEFIFGIYKPDSVDVPTLDDLGFKSLNVGKARINGFELAVNGEGKAGKVTLSFFAGYTYMNPVDLAADTLENNILKYRFKHSFKSNVSAGYRKFSAGVTVVYRSFIERIDEAFEEEILGQEIFPGLKEYRQENNNGNWVIDLRLSYNLTPRTRFSVIAKNLLNEEYMGRPGDIQPPRSFTFQLLIKP